MRKIIMVAAVLGGVVAASPAFAWVDGPVFFGYQHSMQSTGSSELGMPSFRQPTRADCAGSTVLPDYGCDAHASGAYRPR